MHTFKKDDAIFHYNSDLSGDVIIIRVDSKNATSFEVKIDGQAILDFIGNFVRSQRISELEQADTNDILRINKWKNAS